MPTVKLSELQPLQGGKGTVKLSDLREQTPEIVGPGTTPEDPIDEQHPDLGFWDRFKVMNFADNPDVAKRYLESKGFEVGSRGGWNLSIRKPGETTWRVVDPSGWDWSDVTDIGGDVATGVGAGIGATAGVVGGAPTGPGAIATGAAGAAGGAAAVQGLKSIAGQFMGMTPDAGDVLGGMGREAAFGAVGQLGGKAIGKGIEMAAPYVKPAAQKIGGLMQVPLRAPANIVERMTTGPIAQEAKGIAVKALQDIPEDVTTGMVERGISQTAITKAVERASKPLASMGEVQQAMSATFPTIQGMIKGAGEELVPKLKAVLKDQIENQAKNGLDDETIEITRGLIKKVTERAGRTSKLETMNEASEFAQLVEGASPDVQKLFPQELIDFSRTGTELFRKSNRPLSMGPIGTAAPLGIRALTTSMGALGAAGTLGTPGAVVGGGIVGLSALGKGVEMAVPAAEKWATSPITRTATSVAGMKDAYETMQSPVSGPNQWVSKPDTFMQWAQGNQDPILRGPIQKLMQTLQTRGKDAFTSELYVLMYQYPTLREASKQVTGIPSNHSHLTNNKATPRG